MSRSVKLRRGTTADHADFAGLEGEVTVDTSKDTVVVHDGVTLGGHPLAKASDLPDMDEYVAGFGITAIRAILQSDYDALNPPDPMTLYVILPMAVSLSAGSFTLTGNPLA